MRTYQLVLRSPAVDEVRLVRHDNLERGDRITVEGNEWIVDSITRTARWKDVDRAILLPDGTVGGRRNDRSTLERSGVRAPMLPRSDT